MDGFGAWRALEAVRALRQDLRIQWLFETNSSVGRSMNVVASIAVSNVCVVCGGLIVTQTLPSKALCLLVLRLLWPQ